MPKPVRLSSAEARAWRQNAVQLVDEKGSAITALSPEAEAVRHRFEQRSRAEAVNSPNTFRGLKEEIEFDEVGPDGKKRSRKLTFETKVKRTDSTHREGYVMTMFIEGYQCLKTREVMSKRLFARHGECMIQGINGKMLKIVRDPAVAASRKPGKVASGRLAPTPENCPCKDWGEPHPGKHHHVCEWNGIAPAGERGAAPDEAAVPLVVDTKDELFVEAPPKDVKIPSPEECECSGWPGTPTPGEHRPICQFKTAWENRSKERYFIVSMSDGDVVREATQEEQAKAEIEEKRSGMATVSLAGVLYTVMLESDIEKMQLGESAVEESSELDESPEDEESAEAQD